jgi:hypothetical protein
MATQALIQTLNKYITEGVIKGNELLLPPNGAISFLDDLTKIGVWVTGYELWKYVDRDHDPERIVNLLGAGSILSDEQLENKELNILDVRHSIKNSIFERFPPDADLVSFIFLDEEIYNLLSNPSC